MRSFNGREVRFENSVTRVTVRYHEACRVISSDEIVNPHRTTSTDPCSYTLPSTIALEYVLFYQVYTKRTAFIRPRNVRFRSSFIRSRRNVWQKMTWKWRPNRRLDVRHESHLTPHHVRRHSLAFSWYGSYECGLNSFTPTFRWP